MPATNPYSAPALSGYNAAPPPDDGSQTVANTITWAGIRTKLTDTLVTFAGAINSAVAAAFSKTLNTDADQANTVAGSIAYAETTLTVSAGSVTPTRGAHALVTSGGSADQLTTLATSGVDDGATVQLRNGAPGTVITVKHGLGNLSLSGGVDFPLSAAADLIVLRRIGSGWVQIGGSAPASTAASDSDSMPDNSPTLTFWTCR